MNSQPKSRIAFITWLILFATGCLTGWNLRASEWEKELEIAADQIAAKNQAMYLPEFQGAVHLMLTEEPKSNETPASAVD